MKTEQDQPIHPVKMDTHYSAFGLTKREYFAAMAMQGILPNKTIHSGDIEVAAETAILVADELIKQLNKIKPHT